MCLLFDTLLICSSTAIGGERHMIEIDTDALTITDVGHLPIFKHYAKKIQLVETIDAMA